MERRNRFKPPQPTGRRVAPTERDIQIFHAIYRHGPLSTMVLHQLCGGDPCGFSKRLGDLYHEAPYLFRPPKQFDAFEARYQHLIHDLLPAAQQALEARGMLPEPYHVTHRNFAHRYMVSHITASIELACRAIGATYISQPEILRGRPLEFPVKTEWKGYPLDKPYMPDALFAIEKDGKRRYYFLEADRDQEPIKRLGSKPFTSSSWLRKVVQLRHVIRNAKEQLGIDRPLLVLTVTTGAEHEKSMLSCVQEVTGGSNYQLTKTHSAFAGAFRVLPPIENILIGWNRCEGYTQFDLIVG